jgi:hypothetical protein
VAGVKIGQAYVVDVQGRLIAHPDISRVLGNTEMMHFAHVRAGEARDIYGHDVLIACAPVANQNLGWLVFVEFPSHWQTRWRNDERPGTLGSTARRRID